MSTHRQSRLATCVSEDVRALVDALCARRLLTQAELIRDYVNRGVAADIAALAPTHEPV